MTDEVRRPGYYGRVYGDWGTHPKVVGGVLPSGKRCRRLSLAARGLWCSLLSLVIRRKANGKFAAEDAEAEAGPDWVALVSELEAAALIDPDGDGLWVFHDWASNGASVEKYDENRAKQRKWTADSRARKALQEPRARPHPLNLSSSEYLSERELEGKGAGKALHEPRGNASLVKPMTAAEMLAMLPKEHPKPIPGLGEVARKLVIAGFEKRKMAPPTPCRDPMHPYWGELHRWAADTVRLTGEDPEKLLKMTIRAFLNDPRTGEVGQTLSYLVTNPQQYLNLARKDAA